MTFTKFKIFLQKNKIISDRDVTHKRLNAPPKPKLVLEGGRGEV